MLARERLNNVLDAYAMEEVEVRNRPRFVEHSTGRLLRYGFAREKIL